MSEILQEIVSGDSRPYIINLKINDAAFDIPVENSIIKCALVSLDKQTLLSTGTKSVLSTVPGSDWAASKIVVKFDKSMTSAIKYQGKALIEVQITFRAGEPDEYDLTWFVPVVIVKGNIS